MNYTESINSLLELYHENLLAHAYLIETNNIDRCSKDVLKVVKSILCPNSFQEKCSICNICNLIDNNYYPDLKIIEPEGKSIQKDAIEDLKHTFSKMPTYGKYNIYLIKSPEKMNSTAFNRLLKFLEEPEESIIGFFVTGNKDNVANTIVSRCQIIKQIYEIEDEKCKFNLSEDVYKNYKRLASEYIQILKLTPQEIVWYNNSVLSKDLVERIDYINFVKVLCEEILLNNSLEPNAKKHNLLKIMSKYMEQLNYNLNIALLFDSMGIELGETYGK